MQTKTNASCIFTLVLFCALNQVHSEGRRKNVLYVLSDDLRADLGIYGLPVDTPHLDSLAKQGLRFQNAFSQISVCSPSRQSFLTGRRPDTHKVWNFLDHNPRDTQAIPGHFRDNGWLSLGLGKTFHEDSGAWNADKYWNTSILPYYPYKVNKCPHGGQGGGQCVLPEDEIWDYHLRLAGADALKMAGEAYVNSSGKQPFFVAVGFRDPHAPWAAPARMYDLYDESHIQVAKNRTIGVGTPRIAWSDQLEIELANGTSFPYSYDSPVPDWVDRNQRHAYYSAVSFVDEHVGVLMQVLEDAGVANDTIVVFHGDHGYALGEHGEWEKKSNYDLIVRTPLLIKYPGLTDQPDFRHNTTAMFELVDLFPTLSALAGLPEPANVDGIDQSSLIFQPGAAEPKDVAFHQFPACGVHSFNHTRLGCNQVPAHLFDAMGYSIRTKSWRYTRWLWWNKWTLKAKWDGPAAEELYNHTGDDASNFDMWENVNQVAEYPEVVAALRRQLEDFFRAD